MPVFQDITTISGFVPLVKLHRIDAELTAAAPADNLLQTGVTA